MLLKFAIQDFKDDREFKNLSEQTIRNYMIQLNEFQEFCTSKDILNVEDVTVNTVKSYFLYCMKSKNNNPVTVNTKIKNLKAFFIIKNLKRFLQMFLGIIQSNQY
ncbi:hypothetical protein FZC66_15335 [Priestia megaterium]|nr:hypothetical protein FZC66_15335 [Priestia megaterium]